MWRWAAGAVPSTQRSMCGCGLNFAMQDADLSDTDKVRTALELCYPTVPADLGAALDALLVVLSLRRGQPERGQGKRRRTSQKAYCFEQDADYIYAAFLSCYGIDLTDSDMHWWKFRALFRALPQECELVKIMGYRTADLKGNAQGAEEVLREDAETLCPHEQSQRRKRNEPCRARPADAGIRCTPV